MGYMRNLERKCDILYLVCYWYENKHDSIRISEAYLVISEFNIFVFVDRKINNSRIEYTWTSIIC